MKTLFSEKKLGCKGGGLKVLFSEEWWGKLYQRKAILRLNKRRKKSQRIDRGGGGLGNGGKIIKHRNLYCNGEVRDGPTTE